MGKTWQHLSLHSFLTFDWPLFQWGIEIATAPQHCLSHCQLEAECLAPSIPILRAKPEHHLVCLTCLFLTGLTFSAPCLESLGLKVLDDDLEV